MAVQNQLPQFTNSIENHDARTKLREQLTVLAVSGDFTLDVDDYDGQKHLVVSGVGNAAVVDNLADDPDVPLAYSHSYVDGETGDIVTELEVTA